MDDELIFDAVAMCLSSAIEEMSALDEALLRELFGDTWFHIKATRNAIAHNYGFVDEPRLADTVVDELATFEAVLEEILQAA